MLSAGSLNLVPLQRCCLNRAHNSIGKNILQLLVGLSSRQIHSVEVSAVMAVLSFASMILSRRKDSPVVKTLDWETWIGFFSLPLLKICVCGD